MTRQPCDSVPASRRLKSWSELVHEAGCADCRHRSEHRRLMQDRLEVIYPEPTQEEIDAWLIPDDWPEGSE
jgi:hypothetical protein